MKPNFALSLSFEGIQLLQLQENGWGVVGDVDLATADMAGALAQLRGKAESMGRGDVQTKLVIPDDQIKYLTVDATDLDKNALHQAVMTALDGATPYDVQDLAFDYAVDGSTVQIAAVAQETLAEAEAFASEYGFAPIGFVAAPEPHSFAKEPSFGLSQFARQQGITAFETSQSVVKPAGPAVPKPLKPAQNTAAATAPSTPEKSPARTSAAARTEANTAPDVPAPSTAQTTSDATQATSFSSRRAAPDRPSAPVSSSVPNPAPKPVARSVPGPVTAAHAEAQDTAAAPSLSGVSRVPPASQAPGPATPLPPAADLPPAMTRAPHVTGRSDAVVDETDVDMSLSGLRPGAAIGGTVDSAPLAPAFSAAPREMGLADTTPATAPVFESARKKQTAASMSANAGKAAAFAATTGQAALSSVRKLLARSPKNNATPATATVAVAAHGTPQEDEKQRMTVFGARKPKAQKIEVPVGGKPRFLGLILTAILLLFLVSVAAWASVFLDDGLARFFGPQNRDKPIVALSSPDAREESSEEIQIAALDVGLADIDDESVPALTDALPEPAPLPPALTPEEAQAKYAATGIWQATPVQPPMAADIILEDVYTASIDADITGQDAFALTTPSARADSTARGFNAPLPPGSTLTLDENGFVAATPDGALTPEGALVFLGRPPVTPPAVPEQLRRSAQPQEQTPDAAGEQAPQITAASRPKLRPGDLIENAERNLLGGVTLSELSKLRPRNRPELAKQAEEEQQAAVPATAQAVAASRKPDARPRNFANIVAKAARQTAQQQPEAVTQVAAVAPRAVQPKIPSKASVAKNATVKNAINLSRVNLIGVYGKPSSRRALVRLSSGRYKKVKVGDRVDGGRVSAIGDAQLNYTKNGRAITLRMPKS